MNKLIQFLITYLKSFIFMFIYSIIIRFLIDIIIHKSISTYFIYNNLIPTTLVLSIYLTFLISKIEKTVPITNQSTFKKNLNGVLNKHKFEILSDKGDSLTVKHNYIIGKFLTGNMIIFIYKDKALFKGSRIDILTICNNLK